MACNTGLIRNNAYLYRSTLRANMIETTLLVVITEQGENGIHVKINGTSSALPTGLPSAERRETERSAVDRRVAVGKPVAPQPPRPDPEVVAGAKRRSFPAADKQRILAEADARPPLSLEPLVPCCAARAFTPRTWSPGAGNGRLAF